MHRVLQWSRYVVVLLFVLMLVLGSGGYISPLPPWYHALVRVVVLPLIEPLIPMLKKDFSSCPLVFSRQTFWKYAVLMIILGATFWSSSFSIDSVFLVWSAFSFLFLIEGRISFFGALLALIAVISHLLVQNQGQAEVFAISLYYFLGIGVVSDLLVGWIKPAVLPARVSRPLLRFPGGMLPFLKSSSRLHSFLREYGKEMLLILYLGVMFFLILTKKIGLFSPEMFLAFLGVQLFLFWMWKAFYLEELARYAHGLTLLLFIAGMMSLLLSCFIPSFSVPYSGVLVGIFLTGFLFLSLYHREYPAFQLRKTPFQTRTDGGILLGLGVILCLATAYLLFGFPLWGMILGIGTLLGLFVLVVYLSVSPLPRRMHHLTQDA